jgi:tripartite-type tricarboxylate transporter receptor subunit TctC
MLGLPEPAGAQSYPERTVLIIVPTAPGGSIDMTARVVAAKLSEIWGKPVVIENRPGAAMISGAEAVAKSAPDATSCWWRMTHHGNEPGSYPNPSYHSQLDFEPAGW